MKKVLCLALIGLFSLPLVAADDEPIRYYDIELIIFENLDPNSRNKEHWPTSVEQELPESEIVVELNQPFPGRLSRDFDPAMTFKRLSRDKFRLGGVVRKLEKSPTRRVLLHTAWRQPGMSWEEAINVRLTRNVPADNNNPESGSRRTALQGEAGKLEAYIKVILSRYLHVDTDIVFRTKPKTGRFDFYINESEEPEVYRLKQLRRRIRSTELHYLDHPALGMLIIMHPVETDKL